MLSDDAFVDDPMPAELVLDHEPVSEEELDIFHEWGGEILTPEEIAEADGVVEDEDGAPLPGAAHWSITDDDSAEWAGRKYREKMDRVEDVRAKAKRWVERIHAWADDQARKPLADARYFEGQLERYLARRRAASAFTNRKGETDYKVKSIALPSVRLSSRTNGAKMVIDEESALVLWAKTLPDPLREAAVKETFLVSGVKSSVVFEPEQTGWEYALECGCFQRESFDPESPVDAEEDLMCATHHEHTSVLGAEPVTQLQAWLVIPAGEETDTEIRQRVPGVHVDPESVTITVKPA